MAARKSSKPKARKSSSSSERRAPSTRVSSAREKLAEYRRKRDFSRTAEPSGSEARGNEPATSRDESARSKLRFVIQKHAASHLHFDFRLELDGVMKSWAVPKGPSYDPGTKRLAMEVEDHPIAYNKFEGTIPAGEYGGGTVMLWDRGTYGAPGLSGVDGVRALREGYAKGRLDLVMHGERLQGGWALVRMRETSGKPQWLLIKRDDDTADPSRDVVAEVTTSVTTGRAMEEIAAGKGKKRVWHSNREARSSVTPAKKSTAKKATAKKSAAKSTAKSAAKSAAKSGAKSAGSTRAVARKRAAKGASSAAVADPPLHRGRPKAVRASKRLSAIVPMKCSIGTGIPAGDNWTFEPKYDGIRVIAYATAEAANLVTRNGNDKSFQFPEVIDALRELAKKAKRPLVLDGEVVALDGDEVARFQDLQSRMHTTDRAFIETAQEGAPASLVAFDLLVDGDEVITAEPWTVRRARLEQRLRNRTSRPLRLGETVPNDGEELLRKAEKLGWEGVIAKRMDEPYVPGARSRNWLKLKIEHRQEFVVGGWTEPRKTREHIGALLLGHFDQDGSFVYVGHTGGGFTAAGLRDMHRTLAPLERATSPFSEKVKTNEKAHWVTPKIVVEVKFGEWTADGKLRQPIYLGTRDDKPAREVTREAESVQDRGAVRRGARAGASARALGKSAKPATSRAAKKSAETAKTAKTPAAKRGSKRSGPVTDVPVYANAPVVKRLLEIETEGGRGAVSLGRGASIDVSSLNKVYFPKDGITKGALMRYYATVAPLILPTVRDRALVLKRTPEGIDGETFFQQKAPDDPPAGVRVESVPESDGDAKNRLVGGDITTLLYCVQLGCVSTDPWHSRIQSIENPDYTYIDIDPQPKAGFQRVLDCARWAKEELDALGLSAALKTSGSRGLHIAIPLPSSATWETAVTLAQIIAARVAEKHPQDATITRAVGDRSPKSVYMDYLQNIRGKSVAGPYCVRAKPGAMVSTPLAWSELTDDLDPHEYTIETAPIRFSKVGDLWREQMKARNSAAALKGLSRVKKR